MEQDNIEILGAFLNAPLDNGDTIFNMFKALPNAVYGEGEGAMERYVYVPGTREDRVVLVAHIDTVWDKSYDKGLSQAVERKVLFDNGIFHSGSKDCGIGADDRAGCAMLWRLKDSGHSILIVDGEEHGKHGARYLKKSNKSLFNELNNHCFMIELDHMSTNHVSFIQVHNTRRFKNYFKRSTGFVDRRLGGGCDLQILSKKICGANVGVGYYNYHTSKEVLVLKEWENTCSVLKRLLNREQKRYRTSVLKRILSFFKRCIVKTLLVLKIKK